MTEIGQSTTQQSVTIPGADHLSVSLSWGAATDIGHRRKLNEDSLIAQPPVFAVADGMGGHAAGDVASSSVVARLAGIPSSDAIDEEIISAALRQATVDIALADDVDEVGVGTTVTGAALTIQGGEPYFVVFNVGDSRVYVFEAGELYQITVDHSVVQELVDAGVITRAAAETHPESNVITRAVGFNAEPVADFWLLPVRAGIRLLICSDGLTREVDDEELRETLDRGQDASTTANALVAAALESGGRDNVTVVVVDVASSPGSHDIDMTVPRVPPPAG
ncbi:PP2C family protein-serine/threonine phosphatase [Marisediminicola senii]|uniref:PP2C family protein-serine/threonine phosphatase n=1 Tax=Marisediminicola senii TaxID=2711233 RepID=UPI0013ED35F6|nr:protein phosphatase 2C domain-containing protein [Marisediminicola senii]